MNDGIGLYAERINHGQSEIWLGQEGKELTPRRKLATNEVVNVTRRHCDSMIFTAFYADYFSAVGRPAMLSVSTLDEIAADLKLNL
jgi:hypothetical protein